MARLKWSAMYMWLTYGYIKYCLLVNIYVSWIDKQTINLVRMIVMTSQLEVETEHGTSG